MKMCKSQIAARGVAAVLAGATALIGLCSCDEKPVSGIQTVEPASKDEQPAPAAEATPAPETTAVDEATAALLEVMIYDLGRRAADNAGHPELNGGVRNMLEVLLQYRDAKKDSMAGTVEALRLNMLLADTTRNLTAWQRACGFYDEARAAYEALPQEVRELPENKSNLSSICNGKAFCLMRSGDMEQALELYGEALVIDNDLYTPLAPEGGTIPQEGTVSPELSKAAETLLSSYRCLGECQLAADDPEEGRTTLKRGIDMAVALNRLTPGMHMQYIRLLVSMGNLESVCGNEQEVYRHWLKALEMCQLLVKSTPDPVLRNRANAAFQGLLPHVKALHERLNPAEAAPEQPAVEQPATEQPAAAPQLPVGL